MAQRITAVVENGLLRPSEPISLPEGETVVLELVLPEEAAEARVREWDQALAEFWSEGDKYSEEWWNDFERDLKANRLNFEERV